jgi:DNA-binding MarR family transcriptional regulator
MSVKAMALVWDLECPKDYNELTFKPNHKFVLIAYADHADHNGKSIYPAVSTIAKKTGYEERSIQRITSELESMGLLVEDGQGPKGTNRWYIPVNSGGDKISPLTKFRGDKNEKSLGDISSGDISSGDKMTPELKEPKPLYINQELKDSCLSILQEYGYSVFGNTRTGWLKFIHKLNEDTVSITGDRKKIVVSGLSEKYDAQFTLAQVWQEKYAPSFANLGLDLTFTE